MSNLAIADRQNLEAVAARGDLTAALALAIHAVEKRHSIPVLSNVLLTGHGDLLTVTSTDLDLQISVHIPAAADPALSFTLPAHLLSDLVKKAPKSEYVSIIQPELVECERMEWDGKSGKQIAVKVMDFEGNATIDFERAKYTLQPIVAADFPHLITEKPFTHSFDLPGVVLWDMIDSVRGAILTEETRYYLNGIYCHSIEVDGEMMLRMVTTDGHRLYRRDVAMPEGAANMPGVIIPRKTIEVFQKITKGKACPETVTVSTNETRFKLAFDNIEILSKLIDGTFPDYQRVIPSGNEFTAKVSAASLLEAVAGVSLISSERGRAVKYTFGGNSVLLEVKNPDQGNAEMTIPCTFDGESLNIGFNAAYMVEMIAEAVPTGGDITIKLQDHASPTLFTGSRSGWLGVLMPMRV